jgi:hypothetical protein
VDRVLRNTAATISVTFYNGSSAAEADGAVTVTAKKADGTTLFSTTATNDPAVGVYTTVIPPQANLNVLTLTWTGSFSGTAVSIQSVVEIVGGFYFSIAELRNYDTALANTTKFPNEKLVDVRTQVEAEFEDICGRAFVPRFYRETGLEVDYDNWTVWLEKPEPIRITSLTVNSVDQTGWANSGYLTRDKYSPNVLDLTNSAVGLAAYGITTAIEYEYGLTQVPVPVKEKALKRAAQKLKGINSAIDERATTMLIPDVGTVNLAQPGQRGSETGVPDIDVVLNRYKLDGGAGVF